MSIKEWKEWIDYINPKTTTSQWAYQDTKGVMHYFDQEPTKEEILEAENFMEILR